MASKRNPKFTKGRKAKCLRMVAEFTKEKGMPTRDADGPEPVKFEFKVDSGSSDRTTKAERKRQKKGNAVATPKPVRDPYGMYAKKKPRKYNVVDGKYVIGQGIRTKAHSYAKAESEVVGTKVVSILVPCKKTLANGLKDVKYVNVEVPKYATSKPNGVVVDRSGVGSRMSTYTTIRGGRLEEKYAPMVRASAKPGKKEARLERQRARTARKVVASALRELKLTTGSALRMAA